MHAWKLLYRLVVLVPMKRRSRNAVEVLVLVQYILFLSKKNNTKRRGKRMYGVLAFQSVMQRFGMA